MLPSCGSPRRAILFVFELNHQGARIGAVPVMPGAYRAVYGHSAGSSASRKLVAKAPSRGWRAKGKPEWFAKRPTFPGITLQAAIEEGAAPRIRTGGPPAADSHKKRLGVGCTADTPACPLAQTWTGAIYAAGRMFWFTRKNLVGSYFFLTAARRS